MFNALFIYPFLEAVATNLNEAESLCGAGFRRGEAQLEAMGKQMKYLSLYDEDSHLYLADGIIKLFSMKGTELLLLATSDSFRNKDKSKLGFDHHEGLFESLQCSKQLLMSFFMQA